MPPIHPKIAERATVPRYTFPEAGRVLQLQAGKLRRWSVGHDRTYQGRPVHDPPLISIDGELNGELPPLSFLNLIELRFLGSWRRSMALQEIREALVYAADQMDAERPLLELDFKRRGKDLFVEFEGQMIAANRKGQLGWPDAVKSFLDTVDYDEQEQAAFQWWPLGRSRPVLLNTSVNGGRPTTAESGVRTVAIAARLREGWSADEISEDTEASKREIAAAAEVEGFQLVA